MSEQPTYRIDMVGDILGKKEAYFFDIPYYTSEINDELYIMFPITLTAEDGITTITLSAEQEEAIRDDIALLLRSE